MESATVPPPDPMASSFAETVEDGPDAAYCRKAAGIISYNRELVITDFNVVNDPCRTAWDTTKCTDPASAGSWTLPYMLREAAGGKSLDARTVSQFILRLFNTYTNAPVVGGKPLPVRDGAWNRLMKYWRAASPGCSSNPADLDCTLDLKQAPFRLLAIVNRMDLRSGAADPYASGIAGQGRAIFGGLDSTGKPIAVGFIMEYALPAMTTAEVTRWANSWHALAAYTPGTRDYNDHLGLITDGFVRSDAMPGSFRNNGSALVALRSNELAFAPAAAMNPPQEFREFALGCAEGDVACVALGRGMQLIPQLTALTPASDYAHDPMLRATLTAALNRMEADVLREEQVIPDSFLSGAADILPGAGSFRWPSGPNNPVVRRLFALSTCTGCHFRETMDGPPAMHSGFHIDPVTTKLSHFLSQPIVVPDLDGTNVKYDEKLRRQCEFQYLLEGNTATTLTRPSGRQHG